MCTLLEKELALEIYNESSKVKMLSRELEALNKKVKKQRSKDKSEVYAEIAVYSTEIDSLSKKVSKLCWDFFDKIYDGYQGSIVKVVDQQGNSSKSLVVDTFKVDLIGKTDLVLTVIGPLISEVEDVKLLQTIAKIEYFQVFESKGQSLEVVG